MSIEQMIAHEKAMFKTEKIKEIEAIIDKMLEEKTGKFDWYKSWEGQKILEIKGILNDLR